MTQGQNKTEDNETITIEKALLNELIQAASGLKMYSAPCSLAKKQRYEECRADLYKAIDRVKGSVLSHNPTWNILNAKELTFEEKILERFDKINHCLEKISGGREGLRHH